MCWCGWVAGPSAWLSHRCPAVPTPRIFGSPGTPPSALPAETAGVVDPPQGLSVKQENSWKHIQKSLKVLWQTLGKQERGAKGSQDGDSLTRIGTGDFSVDLGANKSSVTCLGSALRHMLYQTNLESLDICFYLVLALPLSSIIHRAHI